METVLVCVTVQKECERLILAGRRFAEAEGLTAHANSIKVRFE